MTKQKSEAEHAKEAAKAENEANKRKQSYERKAVRESDVVGEINPSQKVVPSSPDPYDPNRTENDPRINPHAPGGALQGKE